MPREYTPCIICGDNTPPLLTIKDPEEYFGERIHKKCLKEIKKEE
jgi:hypothetical protein